ncbi:transcriptional regulator cudA, putative (macronuclear) [Tetrahymena thermophila SB210]|uniref:Transcriptional regulator cudA, putative n=1 Tax=Tetrahymena thermophila (strain SB210) TaxID=312017 RepID=I7MIH6_TETTS|nr:transcriptional regulator cudA, putative [Tetrahymena thermophila SB210]EAS04441.2 transcriptional regulator cudA, putative [Tetrahymena thermophila SB210]|eukprot:XP_001024686.2 transcriptional regulator cudA, putative [Tetrahymena thermophila SB210]
MNQDDNFNQDLENLLKDLEEIDKQEAQAQVLQQKFKNMVVDDGKKKQQQTEKELVMMQNQQIHKGQQSLDTKTVQDLLKELDLLDYKLTGANQSFLNNQQSQQYNLQKSYFLGNFDKENSIIRISGQNNSKQDLQLSIIHQQLLQDHFLNNSILQNTTQNNINTNQFNHNHNNNNLQINNQTSNMDDIDQFLKQLDDNNDTLMYSSNLLNNTDVLR